MAEAKSRTSDDSYMFCIESDDNVGCIDEIDKKFIRYECKIGNVKVTAVIDSGSRHNLIDIESWNNLKAAKVKVSQMKASDRSLTGYGNNPLDIIGTFEAELKANGKVGNEIFHVMNERGSILIGRQTAVRMGIIKIAGQEVLAITDTVQATKLNKIKNVLIELTIDKNVKPVQQPYRRVPAPLEEATAAKIQNLLDRDIIEKVDGVASWISPMVIVPKVANEVRLCIDMRRANQAVLKEKYPMPILEDMLPHIGQGKIFSKLDIEHAYHQMELAPNSRDITTFITKQGLYRFKRLMMGISCAPQIFQKKMEVILAGCNGIEIFVDDILVFGTTKNEHDERLKVVLAKLDESNVALNLKKCIIGVPEIIFLGHKFTSKGIKPSEVKLEAVSKFREPATAEEVRSFLGLINYMGKFVPDLATITEPLRQLTKKETKFVWEEAHKKAFTKLKNCLSNESVLGYFDKKDRTQIVADASPVGLGAVLIQLNQDIPRIISFASKSLTDAEKRYCQTEKEALALVWAVERFHFYVCGAEFDLITDHRALEVIFGVKSKPCARIERWVLRLQSYTFKVIYRSGKSNIADVFSRLCQKDEKAIPFDEENDQYIASIVELARPLAVKLAEIESESSLDPEIMSIKQALDTGNWPKDILAYKPFQLELCFAGEVLLRGTRIVIPPRLRGKILTLAHEGHPGIVATKQRLRQKVWWPKN